MVKVVGQTAWSQDEKCSFFDSGYTLGKAIQLAKIRAEFETVNK